MNLVLLGAPGAGKGTQAALLSVKLGIPHVSTGEILREEVKKGSSPGKKVRVFMSKGELVPDELVLEVIKRRLSERDCDKGFILDGFPRTLFQAENLDRLLGKIGKQIDRVIKLNVSEKTALNRLTARLVCQLCGADYNLETRPPQESGKCDLCGGELEQRIDDKKEVILNRLKVYDNQNQALESYYSKLGKLIQVDGGKDKEKVLEELLEVIQKAGT